MKKSNLKIKYDAEADVLSLEQPSRKAIDYATEMGNLVVHFSKKEEPVLIEILEASKLLKHNKKPLISVFALAK